MSVARPQKRLHVSVAHPSYQPSRGELRELARLQGLPDGRLGREKALRLMEKLGDAVVQEVTVQYVDAPRATGGSRL